MPTKKLPDGSSIEFATVEELIAYDRAMGTVGTSLAAPKVNATWIRLMREMPPDAYPAQHFILRLIKGAGDIGISREELAAQFQGDVSNQGLGGRIAAITKACKRVGLTDLAQVIATDGRSYFAGPLLKANEVPE